jgi:hypothetical protein
MIDAVSVDDDRPLQLSLLAMFDRWRTHLLHTWPVLVDGTRDSEIDYDTHHIGALRSLSVACVSLDLKWLLDRHDRNHVPARYRWPSLRLILIARVT